MSSKKPTLKQKIKASLRMLYLRVKFSLYFLLFGFNGLTKCLANEIKKSYSDLDARFQMVFIFSESLTFQLLCKTFDIPPKEMVNHLKRLYVELVKRHLDRSISEVM